MLHLFFCVFAFKIIAAYDHITDTRPLGFPIAVIPGRHAFTGKKNIPGQNHEPLAGRKKILPHIPGTILIVIKTKKISERWGYINVSADTGKSKTEE